MADILQQIVERTRQDLERARRERPEAQLRAGLSHAPPVHDFFAALNVPGTVRLIAEVKQASPSKGLMRADFDPVAIARTYEQHGAACISVLTDEPFFRGSLDYLRAIRGATQVPLLRKDFILSEYQLVEARLAGADGVLLIAECLDDCDLRKLHRAALELGLTPLVELYEPANLSRVLDAGATLIGINNRDLRTFETDLGHTLRLIEQIPDECLVVSESGIRTAADVTRLRSAGVSAILVGESLMQSADIGRAVKELMQTAGG